MGYGGKGKSKGQADRGGWCRGGIWPDQAWGAQPWEADPGWGYDNGGWCPDAKGKGPALPPWRLDAWGNYLPAGAGKDGGRAAGEG